MDNFKGKTAIITGASRGIGKAIAFKLAEKGLNVVIMARNSSEIEETEKELIAKGFNAKMVVGNVSKAEDVNKMIATAEEYFGDIHILVNNAGITRDLLMIKMLEKDWNDVIEVNLKSTFLCTKAVSRHMLKRRQGRIINISSVVGTTGGIGQANYAASKAGIVGFTRSIAREFASRNVTCNVVAPGFITTKMTSELKEEVKQEYLKQIPLKRMGMPEDVANLVAFLASDEASYITGQVIHIDGGLVMY